MSWGVLIRGVWFNSLLDDIKARSMRFRSGFWRICRCSLNVDSLDGLGDSDLDRVNAFFIPSNFSTASIELITDSIENLTILIAKLINASCIEDRIQNATLIRLTHKIMATPLSCEIKPLLWAPSSENERNFLCSHRILQFEFVFHGQNVLLNIEFWIMRQTFLYFYVVKNHLIRKSILSWKKNEKLFRMKGKRWVGCYIDKPKRYSFERCMWFAIKMM